MAEASLVVKSVKRDTSIAPQVRSSSASGAWSKRGLLLAVYLVPAVGADRFAGGDGKAIQGELGWGPAQVEPMWPMPDDDGQPLRSLVGPPSLPWSLEHSQQTQAEDETYSFSVEPTETPPSNDSSGTGSSSHSGRGDGMSAEGYVLLGMGLLSLGNLFISSVSHWKCLDGHPLLKAVLRRHESMLGENMSVRGLIQFYAYATAAFPEKDTSTEYWMKWMAAGLLAQNVRVLWESAESLFAFPNRPGYVQYEKYKDALNTPGSLLSWTFPIVGLFSLPCVGEAMDKSTFVRRWDQYIHWGVVDLSGRPGHATAAGFKNVDALMQFQFRLQAIAILGEAVNTFGILNSGKSYTWHNAVGMLAYLYLMPQVGSSMVMGLRMLPLVGRINAVQHGDGGSGFTKSLSRFWLGRLATYAVLTPLATWPEYDILMTATGLIPGGKGIAETGLGKCLSEPGWACVGGPTKFLYEKSGGSPWAFTPLIASVIFKVVTMTYLKMAYERPPQQYFNDPAWGPLDMDAYLGYQPQTHPVPPVDLSQSDSGTELGRVPARMDQKYPVHPASLQVPATAHVRVVVDDEIDDSGVERSGGGDRSVERVDADEFAMAAPLTLPSRRGSPDHDSVIGPADFANPPRSGRRAPERVERSRDEVLFSPGKQMTASSFALQYSSELMARGLLDSFLDGTSAEQQAIARAIAPGLRLTGA